MARAMRDYEERGYDSACFNSEQAVQLTIKAALYRIFGRGSGYIVLKLFYLILEIYSIGAIERI